MKTLLTEYLYFTRAERNGAWLLCFLCILLALAPKIYPYWFNNSTSPDFQILLVQPTDNEQPSDLAMPATEATLFPFDPNTASQEDLVALGLSPKLAQTIVNYRNKGGKFRKKEDLQKIYTLKSADYERLALWVRIGSGSAPFHKDYHQRKRAVATLFAFDPNIASRNDLVTLGLPEWLADNILKYRDKGGAFRKPEDLKKIYGIRETDYERLAPYIQIAEKTNTPKAEPASTMQPERLAVESPDSKTPTRAAKTITAIDINKADTDAWQQLPGIGPVFAKKIVGFREKLGGFSSIEQVRETYGLPDSTFQQILPYLRESSVFRFIEINSADIETLKAHPYIDARLATGIVNYRSQHGPYASAEDLRKLRALQPDQLEKLKPYLKF